MKIVGQWISAIVMVGFFLLNPTPAMAANYIFNGTGGDDTNAINGLITGLASGDKLTLNGNCKVRTIAMWS